MARTKLKRNGTSRRPFGPFVRFAPDLLALEDRTVPAFIYVDLAFTGTAGASPDQDFNAGGTGPLGTVPAASLTFVAAGTPAGAGGVTGAGKFAVADLTTAFNSARDNPGEDTILLAAGTFPLDNSQGQSLTGGFGGFNDNSYFFNTDPLSILGSGPTASVIQPTADTYDPADPDTASDPVLAVRQGATFVATDFGLDGSLGRFGVGIGVSDGRDPVTGTGGVAVIATLTRLNVTGIVAEDGAGTGGATAGVGVQANPNAGGSVTVQDSTFGGNARAGVGFTDADGQVLGSTFTGRGAGDLVDYGVQVLGASNVYASGNAISGYQGQSTLDGTNSAGILVAQDVDPTTGVAIPGGATLLAVGNKIAGNSFGVVLGSDASTGTDDSKAVVNFNDLSDNTVAGLDATASLAGAGVLTGIDAGIDGRNNFFGGTGPLRAANTGSSGDARINPTGTGSAANGNVSIGGFRTATVPATTVPSTFGTVGGAVLADELPVVRAAFFGPGVALTIYVNGPATAFTAGAGTNPAQDFNAGGVGLATVAKTDLTFLASGTPFGPGGVTAAGKYAVPDLATALGLARDNPGADIVNLAASDTPFALDNSQGLSTQNGGFNDNSYFFNNSPLTILGSGAGKSVIQPTASTLTAADPDSKSDPVLAIRQGGSLTLSGATLDGSQGLFGVGIGTSGGSSLTLTDAAVNNFVAQDGTATNGATFGFGVFVSNDPGAAGFITVTGTTFTGNARVGLGLANANAQVTGSTFTGRGAGNLVDYGVQVIGQSNVFVSGSTFTNFLGKAQSDDSSSAAIVASQEIDPATNLPVGVGASLLVAGNKITGNTFGVVLGTGQSPADTSVAVVNFNDLSGNAVGLDATFSQATGTTGTDSGIDGRSNFFGAGGPLRAAINPENGLPNNTGAAGDELLFPGGTGSQANGNVNISGFRLIPVSPAVPVTVPGVTFGTVGGQTLAAGAGVVQAFFAAAPPTPTTLIIYVNGVGDSDGDGKADTFTDLDVDGKTDQAFNPSGVGPIDRTGTGAGALAFVPANATFGGFTLPANGKIAVPDLATAFAIARDNLGADTIFVANNPTPYDLNNAGAGGPGGNTYLFPGAANTLTIGGSGIGNSVIRPTASTYDGTDVTAFDPVFAVQSGNTFTGSDFAFDGSQAKFGGGIGISGGTKATLTNVALRNFVAEDGAGKNGISSGYGLFVNPNAGALVSITGGQFSGNGRIGVGFAGDSSAANGQIINSTFTGRGSGNFVDYGVQASGGSSVFVTGSTFSGFQGQAGIDQTESAAISIAQGTQDDPLGGPATPFAGGAALLAVGNKITGNRIGVSVQNATAAGTSTAAVRFNDLSNNNRAFDAAGATTVTASNNFIGASAAGNVTPIDARLVTAPTLNVASTFGATTTDLTAAATAAGTAYVTDPRVQSNVTIAAQGTQPFTGDVTFLVTFSDVLASQDKTLFSATFTAPGKAAQTFTSGQLTVGTPVTTAAGSTVTVTVPRALLTSGPAGTVTLNLAASSTSARTGNAQLTVNGFQTAADSASAQFGAANTGPTLTRVTPANGIAQVGLNGGTTTATFTATAGGGRTIVSTTAVSNNTALVTVSPANAGTSGTPSFTLTGVGNAPGVATVTVTTTDSDGLTDTETIAVQVGSTAGVTLALSPSGLVFALNATAAQTVTGTVSFPNGSGTVTFNNPRPDLATVVQGGTSTSPTFTVTPAAGQTGSVVVSVTATDASGATTTSAFGVQVGNTAAANISGVPTTTQVIPFNRTITVPVSVSGTAPFTLTGTSSNPNVATVAVTGTGANRTVTVTANPGLTAGGPATITLNLVDANNQQSSASFTVQVAPARTRLLATGSGPGSAPAVQTYSQNGVKGFGFTAFELPFTGGVVVATGDVNGDGVDDIVAGANVGGGPRIRIIDGKTGVQIANFFAFEETFRGGVTVAVAKVIDTGTSADGFFREQVIVGAGDGGGPRVSVFDINPATGGFTRTANFFAYESTFRNGVSVAGGDLTGDGLAEIITGAGVGGGPRVRAFTAAGNPTGLDFFAFDSGYRGGVNVAAGLLDGTGKASIVAGSGENNGSLVRVFGPTGTQTAQFAAYPDASSAPKAVRVGVGQFTATGPESILTGAGPGNGPLFKVFSGGNPGGGTIFQDFAFEQPFRGGIFVG